MEEFNRFWCRGFDYAFQRYISGHMNIYNFLDSKKDLLIRLRGFCNNNVGGYSVDKYKTIIEYEFTLNDQLCKGNLDRNFVAESISNSPINEDL